MANLYLQLTIIHMMIKQKANKETNISTGISLPYQNPQYHKYSFSMFYIPIYTLPGFLRLRLPGSETSTMCQCRPLDAAALYK